MLHYLFGTLVACFMVLKDPLPTCAVPCHVPRKKGRYFFEVELHFGVESPQVGLLASHFELAPRTADPHGEQLVFFVQKYKVKLMLNGYEISWHQKEKHFDKL